MIMLRKMIKIFLLIGLLLIGFVLSLTFFSPWLYKMLPAHWPSMIAIKWSRMLCRICGLQIRCYGNRVATSTLFVANHISWLDIFAFASTFSVIFLSKQEISKWPIFGLIANNVGTLFIRRGKFETSNLISSIAQALLNQKNVLVFPEGTSSDGKSVKRFHARMFQAAIDAKMQIQPVALRYPQDDGISSIAPFIDNDTFKVSVWRILGERKLDVELWFCPPISATDRKRDELANYARKQILDVLEQALPEKL